MKNFIIAILSAIILASVGYYCYIYFYKKENFQSDKYLLLIDNSQLTKERFPNYNKIIEKPVTEKEHLFGFFENKYPLSGSSLFEDIRTDYYRWFEKSNIIKNIRKNPEKITTLFNDFKADFYDLVPSSTYTNSNIETVIHLLIMSYDDLHKNAGLVNQNMNNIYGSMNSSNDDNKYYHHDYYLDEIISPQSKETFDNLYKEIDSKFTITDRNWFYSFWVRRYKEGNINKTIAIIREVNQHYNPDSEESEE